LEIEAAVRESGYVKDVVVRRAATLADNGNERIAVEIVPVNIATFDVTRLREYLRSVLASYKIPDIIHVRDHIARNAQGKVVAGPRYAIAAGGILAAVRAYKQSELVFALHQSGMLPLLAHTTDAAELADRCGLNVDAVEAVLDIAKALGLITLASTTDRDKGKEFDTIRHFLDLEEILSQDIVTRQSIEDFLRNGGRSRIFEKTNRAEGILDTYAHAMHGRLAQLRARFALTKVSMPPGALVLEISSGPGRYVEQILTTQPEATGVLVPLGALSGYPTAAVEKLKRERRLQISHQIPKRDERYDFVVINNAIHSEAVLCELEGICARIRLGGTLLIDDIFLPEVGPGNEIALDWFTHGGYSVRRLDDLQARLSLLGMQAMVHSVPGDELHRLTFVMPDVQFRRTGGRLAQ
jgi:SAM-dependent methyltransferase